MKNNNGFVAGTFVLIQTEDGLDRKPIQDIKIGDIVLSKPENGIGENEGKKVLNTFVHKDQPIWLLKTKFSYLPYDAEGNDVVQGGFITSGLDEFSILVTPNHPILVIGSSNTADKLYDMPIWRRVDELQSNDLVINDKGLIYEIILAKPVYYYQPHEDFEIDREDELYWYQKNCIDNFENYYEKYINGDVKPDLTMSKEEHRAEYEAEGYLLDIEDYINNGFISEYEFTSTRPNKLTDDKGNYIPFTYDVHNIEVEDNHTYFVDLSSILVGQ